MARITAKITGLSSKEVENAILDEVTSRWSRRRQDIRKTVLTEIESVVEANKDRFQPQRSTLGGPETVAQLGVGNNGAPDTEKLRRAYKLLIPARSSTISTVRVSFQRRASRFGKVEFNLNIDRFFDAEATNYLSSHARANGEISVIPWMKNFIFGFAVQDYAFIDSSDPDFHEKSSRTGLGHMIKIGEEKVQVPRRQFAFAGVGTGQTFDILFTRVKKRLERASFINKIEQIIAGG